MLLNPLRIALLAGIATCAIACGRPVSTDPSTYVGRYKLINPDSERSDLPSGIELRSDMTVIEFFGDERTSVARAAGRWRLYVYKKSDVDIGFSDFNHPVRSRSGEIRLYVNSDLDEYFVKSQK